MEHSEAAETMAAERYLLGEMTPEDRDAFEDHFFGCPDCAAAVRDGAAIDAAIRVDQVTRAREPQKSRAAWIAAAAVIVAVLIGVPAVQNVRLRNELQSARTPKVVQSYSLLTADSRGSERLTVKSASQPFTIDFDVPPQPDAHGYVIRVVDVSGKLRLAARIPAGVASETQHLFFPAGSLKAGLYSIEVQDDPPRSPATKWSFEVGP